MNADENQAMFKGTVKFGARIKGNGLKFPLFEFNPYEAGVEKVEVEGPNGDEILSTVHLASVASHQDGRGIAITVNASTLNRISLNHNIAVENDQITSSQFAPLNPQPGARLYPDTGDYVTTGEAVRSVLGIPAETIKAQLEQVSPQGEQYFSLFRSARHSQSPVEEFMHLYNLLLMLFEDKQTKVDAFILSVDPNVQQTPDPRPESNRQETVYTRLRNEFGHARPRVNLDNTKAEMKDRLGDLVALTKRAIELRG